MPASKSKNDPLALAIKWCQATAALVWLAIISAFLRGPLGVVNVGSITIWSGLIAAATVMIVVGGWTVFHAIGGRRKGIRVSALLGTLGCAIPVGFSAVLLLTDPSLFPWRGSRSASVYMLTLLFSLAYFIPVFVGLLPRLRLHRLVYWGMLALVILIMSFPLPFVRIAWVGVVRPELMRTIEDRIALEDFGEERGWYIHNRGKQVPIEIRVSRGVFDGSAGSWLRENFPESPVRLSIEQGEGLIDDGGTAALPHFNLVGFLGDKSDFRTAGDRVVLRALSRCPTLKQLSLSGAIDAGDMELVAEIPYLQSLFLTALYPTNPERKNSHVTTRPPVSGRFEPLVESPKLQGLSVNSSYTDEDLQSIGKLKHLRWLELAHPHLGIDLFSNPQRRIDRKGLYHLHKLQSLESFTLLSSEDVEPSVLEDLTAALPNCKIDIRPGRRSSINRIRWKR